MKPAVQLPDTLIPVGIDTAPLRNRLGKNAKHWGKWARRQQISCYRIYDRDIPEFPVAIDMYEDKVCIQEFDTGWKQTDAEHAAWGVAVKTAVSDVLGVSESQVWFKLRQRQKGEEQYEKTGEMGEDFIAHEGGHLFWVNLGAYLDTGLFLDHRPTRMRVGSMAQGKRFLNLFAYTGSFSVYAAKGGAVSSETVDLSNTYQAWTARNFELNQIDRTQHILTRADVFTWLREAVDEGKRFDLIVLDPPTFSNSKKMLGILDIQRDHPWLIRQCLSLLTRGGTLFFSTNLRSFELDPGIQAMADVKNISAQSVPEDFRNKKIHQCFSIQHR
ncbi:class I SAM-dependent methyltransferase [Leeia oryzae]|uniref:class I SAM-dependent methyltransferase n=1 Tax=Leeia oryzae TaxID=356662 RepID=UPI0003805313|nr:class I SAM-dependent methyltransferase [Leeia oryzae]